MFRDMIKGLTISLSSNDSTMPKQVFELTDYFGPVVVAVIFAIVLLLISFFFINWFCVNHKDDLTAFEKVSLIVR